MTFDCDTNWIGQFIFYGFNQSGRRLGCVYAVVTCTVARTSLLQSVFNTIYQVWIVDSVKEEQKSMEKRRSTTKVHLIFLKLLT